MSWLDYIFFEKKKPVMKFIILVSNLKEISPSVFSWKKKNNIRNDDAILLSKYDSAVNKGNNKITELRAILQRESQNS